MESIRQPVGWLTRFSHSLLDAHPSITNPVERKLCSVIALFHLVGLPLSPALFLLNQTWDLKRTPLLLEWLFIVLGATVLSYALLRSPWMKLSFLFQVIIATFLPLHSSYQHPASQGAHFSLIIPIILSSIYFDRRYLFAVLGVTFTGLFCLYPGFTQNHQSVLSESIAILAVCCFVVVMGRLYHEWLNRHHQDTLKQQYEQFEQLLSASFRGTAKLIDGSLTEVTDGFAQTLDYSSDSLEGRKIKTLLPSFGGDSKTLDTHSFYHSDGVLSFVELLRTPLHSNQEVIAIRDVTHQTLEHVKQLQMDRVSAAGTLASGIAHELNTPLMVAMNQTRIISNRLADSDIEDQRKRLGVIDDVLEQMSSIISDLKWFVQTSVEDSSINTSDIIQNTIRLANHRIRHECEIELDLKSTRKPAFTGHSLAQLLSNFLFNAAGARKSDESTVKVIVSTRDEPDYFVLEVQDFGTGMLPEVANRAFEPFFTHGKRSGTGLGLAICHSLITRANGRIVIDTTPGQGCKITVKLPFNDQMVEPLQVLGSTSKIERVLVVDDDPILPSIIGEFLGNYECTFSTSTLEALELIDTDDIDAIVCDVNMPCGGANHLYAKLQHMHHPLTQRFVVITGGAVSLEMQAFIDQTKQPVIFKPFRATQLINAISQLA
jgi:two-component system, NtrC family, sensor kinase